MTTLESVQPCPTRSNPCSSEHPVVMHGVKAKLELTDRSRPRGWGFTSRATHPYVKMGTVFSEDHRVEKAGGDDTKGGKDGHGNGGALTRTGRCIVQAIEVVRPRCRSGVGKA